MNEFILYLLKSTICLSLLYLVFRSLMRKESFFALNRMLLIALVLFSLTVPLVPMPQIVRTANPFQRISTFTATEKIIQEFPQSGINGQVEVKRSTAFPVRQLLQYSYLAGLLITLLILIRGIVSIFLLLRKARIIRMENFRLLIVDKEIPAFSFYRNVVISGQDYDDHLQVMLAHEQAHIRLNHFFDLLLLEVVKIIHWFNPVVYLLIRDMKEIHEFQADQFTLTKGIDATKYQLLIIQKGVGSQRFALANSFNYCQIKKRIAMINKQKTNKAWSWKVATFLPLLALLLMAFGRKGESSPLGSSGLSSISQVSSSDSIRKNNRPPHAPPSILAILPVDVNKNSLYVLDGNIIDKNKMETILYTGIESIYVLKNKSATDLYGEKAINGVVVITSKMKGMNGNTSTGVKEYNTHLKNNDCIYVATIDQMCEFPGGEIRLRQFIAEQTKYPENAKKDKAEGRVFVNFVVNSKGKVINTKIAQGISPLLDAEAIRVVNSMPDWIPGKVQGEVVNVYYTIPVRFSLQTKE